MRKPEESRSLVEAFTPDAVGGTRDNMGGALYNGLNRVLMHCTMARHLEDPQYIHPKDITALCNAVEWFEAVFRELEEYRRMLTVGQPRRYTRRDCPKRNAEFPLFSRKFPL